MNSGCNFIHSQPGRPHTSEAFNTPCFHSFYHHCGDWTAFCPPPAKVNGSCATCNGERNVFCQKRCFWTDVDSTAERANIRAAESANGNAHVSSKGGILNVLQTRRCSFTAEYAKEPACRPSALIHKPFQRRKRTKRTMSPQIGGREL